MLAACDRGIVQELKRAVVVDEGSVGRVADSLVVRNSDGRNAPGDRIAAAEARDLQFIDDVPDSGEKCADRIKEAGVAEAGLGHNKWRKHAGVGAGVLLEVGQELGPVQIESGSGGVF